MKESDVTALIKGIAPTIRELHDGLLKRIDAMAQRAAKQQEQIDSLERRASRHAEHLSRIQSKLQAERK